VVIVVVVGVVPLGSKKVGISPRPNIEKLLEEDDCNYNESIRKRVIGI
jgi:hypothetical protein